MRTQNWRWLVAFCLPLLMAASGRYLFAVGAATPGARLNAAAVPLRLGDWQGVEIPVSAEELARLDREAEIRRTYTNAAGEKLSAAVVYSSNWKGLHSAESCLTGAGWDIVRQYQVAVPDGNQQAPGTVLLTRDQHGVQLVELYMFVNRQGITANWIDQFWMLVRNRGRGDMACHFILNQRVGPGQTPEASAEVLRGFAGEMLPYVRQSLGA
jgi:EpsI family protein